MADDILFKVGIDNSKFLNGMNQMEKKTDNFGKTVKHIGGIVLTAFGGMQLANAFKTSIKLASDAEETYSKLDVVFGDLAKSQREWINDQSKLIGRSRLDLAKYTGNIQNMLVGFGLARDEAQGFSQNITKLGIDLASFNNLADEDALANLESALIGNHMAAKGLGAVLNETTLQASMMELGFKGVFAELQENEKILVRYNAIVMQSGDTIGDAIRTSDSFANQMKRLEANVVDLGISFGNKFIPILAQGIKFVNDTAMPVLIDFFENPLESIRKFYEGLNFVAKAIIGIGSAFLILKSAMAVWKALITILNTGGQAIIGVFKAIISPIGLLSIAIYALRVAWDNNWFGIQEKTQLVWNTISPILTNIWDNIKNIANVVIDWTINTFGDVWDWFQDSNIVNNVSNGLLAIWDVVSGAVSKTINWAVDTAGNIWDWITQPEKIEKINSFFEFIGGLVSKTIEITGNLLGSFWDWLSDTWITIQPYAVKLFDWLTDMTSSVFEWSISGLDLIVDFFNDIKNAFSGENTFSDVLKAIEDFGIKLADWLWEGVKTGWNAIVDFISIFSTPINNAIDGAIQWGKDFATNLIDGIKSVVQFFNPFEWFKDGGQVTRVKPLSGGAMSGYIEMERRANGGYISGAGTGTSDSIPAWLSNGEFVMNARSTAKYLPILQDMNKNKFANGGIVGYQTGGQVQSTGFDFNAIFEDVSNTMIKDFNTATNFLDEKLSGLFGNLEMPELLTNDEAFTKLEDDINKTSDMFEKFELGIKDMTDTLVKGSELLKKNGETGSIELMDFASILGNSFGIITELFMSIDTVNQVLNPFTTIIANIFKVIAPMVSSVFQPFASALATIGELFGAVILPFLFVLKFLLTPITVLLTMFTYGLDQVILWFNSLPFIGGFLSAEEVAQKQVSAEDRVNQNLISPTEPTRPGAPAIVNQGESISAGSTRIEQTYNTYNFNGEYIQNDDKSIRRLFNLLDDFANAENRTIGGEA